MCHMVEDSDNNDDIESDEVVVMDENIKKASQFAGVTHVDDREVTKNAGVTNQMTLDSDTIDSIESRNKDLAKETKHKLVLREDSNMCQHFLMTKP